MHLPGFFRLHWRGSDSLVSWITPEFFLFGSSVCTFAFICSPESWVYWSISHSRLWTTRWDRMKWTSSVRRRNMLIVFVHSRTHLAAGIVTFQTKCLKLLFLWCPFCTILYPSGRPIISNWGWSWWLFSFLQALNGLFGGSAANTVGPFSVKDDASALRRLTKIYASICSCQLRLFGYAIVKAFISARIL